MEYMGTFKRRPGNMVTHLKVKEANGTFYPGTSVMIL
jgi:hypothetical protein